MKTLFKALTLACGMALLFACGGGGSLATTFAGKVIDGYVGGAKVCIDVNSNAVCDAGEPSATTDSTGSYSFTYSGSVAGMHIIAEVPVGAVDSDLGPVTKTYSLFAPAASASVVTPLSTLVSSEMIANKSTAAAAEQSVKTSLNLNPTSNLVGYDFKSAGDNATTKLAQVIVAAIAQTSDTLKKDSTYQAANISAGDTVKQAITQVKNNILPQVMNADGSLALNGATAADRIAQINTVATTTLSGRINNIVAATKSGDGSVANMADVFKQGLILASFDSGQYKDAQNKIQSFYNNLKVSLIKFDLANKFDLVDNNEKIFAPPNWFSTYQSGADWEFTGTNWEKSIRGFYRPVVRDNCIDFTQVASGKEVVTACGIAKDLSSKIIADYIPNLCKNGDIQIADCDKNAIFPVNSIAYDFTGSYQSDRYSVWADDNWGGYTTTPANSDKIVDLIANFQQSPQYVGRGCNTAAKVLSYDSSAKSGKMGWASTGSTNCSNLSGSYTYAPTNQTNFNVVSLNGKEILKIEVSSLYRINNPGDNSLYRIFAYLDTGLNKGFRSGDFRPANSKLSIPFTGDPSTNTQVMSPAMFNAILAARKMTPYPYP